MSSIREDREDPEAFPKARIRRVGEWPYSLLWQTVVQRSGTPSSHICEGS